MSQLQELVIPILRQQLLRSDSELKTMNDDVLRQLIDIKTSIKIYTVVTEEWYGSPQMLPNGQITTIKSFIDKDNAEAYKTQLEQSYNLDIIILEQEICM